MATNCKIDFSGLSYFRFSIENDNFFQQAAVTTLQTNLDGAGISCVVDLKKEFTISGVPINLSKKYSLIVGAGPLMGGKVFRLQESLKRAIHSLTAEPFCYYFGSL